MKTRPIIFNIVVIDSYHRAQEFRSLLRSTVVSPSLGSCVKCIDLVDHYYSERGQSVPRRRSPPWIHLILHFLPITSLPKLSRIFLIPTVSKTPQREIALRSVYNGLPRTLPHSSCITRHVKFTVHYIANVSFDTFNHLLSTIRSFDCGLVSCRNLTWLDGDSFSVSDAAAALRNMALRYGMKKYASLLVKNCTDVWPLSLALLTTSRSGKGAQSGLYVDPTELPLILNTLNCVSVGDSLNGKTFEFCTDQGK